MEIRALFYRSPPPVLRPRALIYVCEKAPLVSQTLNGALALITANLWPLLVITDAAAEAAAAAAESYHRPAQKYTDVGWDGRPLRQAATPRGGKQRSKGTERQRKPLATPF